MPVLQHSYKITRDFPAAIRYYLNIRTKGGRAVAQILIVEDDRNIAELIVDFLELAGYQTENAYDGLDALEKAQSGNYDLILLDIMLPKLDGFEVARQLGPSEVPILFLSAKSDPESVVRGLRLGGQDYIRKPFDRLELLARIELVLSRYNKDKKIYRFRDIVLDTARRQVTRDGSPVSLRPKEYALLELLIKNENIALSRDEILNIVWGVTIDIETRTVDYHIQQLRKKLDLKKEIVTVNKIGYRLEQQS